MFDREKEVDEIMKDVYRKQMLTDYIKDYFSYYGVGPVLEYFYFEDGRTYAVESDKYGNYSITGW